MGEADRKMLKAAIKHSSGGEDQIRHRQVPPEVVSKWSQKLDSAKQEISEILVEEKEEKQVSAPAFYRSVIAVHNATPLTASPSRNGTQEGPEHD